MRWCKEHQSEILEREREGFHPWRRDKMRILKAILMSHILVWLMVIIKDRKECETGKNRAQGFVSSRFEIAKDCKNDPPYMQTLLSELVVC